MTTTAQFEIQAELRANTGKGANRRLRRADKVPAILYGADKIPQNLVLNHQEMMRHLEQEAFYSHILTLHVDGKKERAVLKALQRHPSKPRLVHLDFLRVGDKDKIRMHVPLHFVGADQSPAVKLSKAIVTHMMNNVEVSCLGKDLPEYIEVDLSKLSEGQTVHLSDIVLPSGVELTSLISGHDQAVAAVHIPRGSIEEQAATAPAATGESGSAS